MSQFNQPRRQELLPDNETGPMPEASYEADVFGASEFTEFFDDSGEISAETESALSVSTGVGMMALDQTVELQDVPSDHTKGSWLSRVKSSITEKKNAIMTGALVSGAVGSWLFEIGPANENLRADVAVELLNQNRGALAAALAVSGITFAVESAAGILSAKTINKEDGMLGRFNKFLFKHTEEMNLDVETEDGHRKSDTLLGLAGGSVLVVIERLRRNPEREYKDSRKTAIAAAAGIAAFSGAITGVAGDLIDWSVENNYYVQGNALKETLEDWRTWVGLFAVSQISPQLKKLTSKFANKEPEEAEADEEIIDIRPNITPDPEAWEELDRVVRRRENRKMAAKIAASVGFIAAGGPQEMAQFVDSYSITHEAGGWLADNQAIDTAEDYASVMWDWRIYAAGFGSLLAGNKLVSKLQNKEA